jgi:hypothetical protein
MTSKRFKTTVGGWNICSADILATILSFLDIKHHARCQRMSKTTNTAGNRLKSFPRIVPVSIVQLKQCDALCKRHPKLAFSHEFSQGLFSGYHDFKGLATRQLVQLEIRTDDFEHICSTLDMSKMKHLTLRGFRSEPKVIQSLQQLDVLILQEDTSGVHPRNNDLRELVNWCSHLSGVRHLCLELNCQRWANIQVAEISKMISKIRVDTIELRLFDVHMTKWVIDALSGFTNLVRLRLENPKLTGESLSGLSSKCELVIPTQIGDGSFPPNWAASIANCDIHKLSVMVRDAEPVNVIASLPTIRELNVWWCSTRLSPNFQTITTLETLELDGLPITGTHEFPPQLRKLKFVNGMTRPCSHLVCLTQLEELTIRHKYGTDNKTDPIVVDLSLLPSSLTTLKIDGGRGNRVSIVNVASIGGSLRRLDLRNVTVDGWVWGDFVNKVPDLRVLKLVKTAGIDFSDPSPLVKLASLSKLHWDNPDVSVSDYQKYIDPDIHLPRLAKLRLLGGENFVSRWESRMVDCRIRRLCSNCS